MRVLILPILITTALSACSTSDSAPLFFGQGTTVGISAGPAASNQASPELIVGVKHANIALVPTVIPKDVPIPNDKNTNRKIVAHGQDSKNAKQDALSTFGSFSNTTKPDNVNLGIFFATGVAAQNISNGFKCGVMDASAQAECAKKTN